MKKKILFLLLIPLACINANAIESDSLLISIHKDDSLDYNVNLKFENISNDTILLISNFRHSVKEAPIVSGFKITFYQEQYSFLRSLGDLYTEEYEFNNGRTFIYPKSTVSFGIDLLEYFPDVKEHLEYGVDFEIAYKYIVISQDVKKRKVEIIKTKTQYVRVN